MTTTSTWDDVGALARAVAELTGRANLSHDLLLDLAGPIVERLATAVADLRMDPHGDSDGQAEPHTQRPRHGSSEAWSIRAGERLLERARVVAEDRQLPGTTDAQTSAWSPEWPTDPGHYWTYRVSDASMAIVEMRLCLTSEESSLAKEGADVTPTERRAYFGGWTATKTAFESHRPANQLLWGPRVDRPAPPALPL